MFWEHLFHCKPPKTRRLLYKYFLWRSITCYIFHQFFTLFTAAGNKCLQKQSSGIGKELQEAILLYNVLSKSFTTRNAETQAFLKKIKSVLRLLAKNSGLEVEMIEMSPLVCFLNKFFREFFFLVNDIQNVPEGKA